MFHREKTDSCRKFGDGQSLQFAFGKKSMKTVHFKVFETDSVKLLSCSSFRIWFCAILCYFLSFQDDERRQLLILSIEISENVMDTLIPGIFTYF